MYKLIILLALTILSMVGCSAQTVGNKSQSTSTSSPEVVIRLYVERSKRREFSKIIELTSGIGDGPLNDGKLTTSSNSKENLSSFPSLSPDRKSQSQSQLNWVRVEFPKSIAEQESAVEEVNSIRLTESTANFEVFFRENGSINPVGWIYKLRLFEGTWKIIDISTISDVE